MQYGAETVDSGTRTATQATIASKYNFPKIDRSKPLTMVARTETGAAIQIDDPAQQKAFISKTYQMTATKAIEQLVAEAKAGLAPGTLSNAPQTVEGGIAPVVATASAPAASAVASKKLPTGAIIAALAAAALFFTMK